MKLFFLALVATLTLVACAKSEGKTALVTPVGNTANGPVASAASNDQAAPATSATGQSATASNSTASWISLGNNAMDSGKYPEAILAYGKALELDPSNVDVRTDLGTCFRNAGQPEKAIEEYRKGLAVNPNHANANRNMGVVLSNDLNRKAEALPYFEKYLKVYPNAPDAAQILSTITALRAGK